MSRKKVPTGADTVPVVESVELGTAEAPQKTAPKRKDPVPRPVDMVGMGAKIVGLDPERAYGLANPSDQISGLAHFLSLGYEIEYARPDGPSVTNALQPEEGQELKWRGSVLVSCTKEWKRELDETGAGMCAGRQGVDARMNDVYQRGNNVETEKMMNRQVPNQQVGARGVPEYFRFERTFTGR